MGYAQYGTRDGFPVVNAHGGLACRLDVAAAHLAAAEADVRLISTGRATSQNCSIRSTLRGSP